MLNDADVDAKVTTDLLVLLYTIFFRLTEFFSFQNNPKNLDMSYKTDLDLWDCLGRVKLLL